MPHHVHGQYDDITGGVSNFGCRRNSSPARPPRVPSWRAGGGLLHFGLDLGQFSCFYCYLFENLWRNTCCQSGLSWEVELRSLLPLDGAYMPISTRRSQKWM
jgi:hypothetical protein